MGRDDWFRSETWNESTRTAFETRLTRSRTAFHRAQYLRIQGLTLTETNKRREVNAGRALLERVITEYPDDVLEVAGAHSALADSFVQTNQLREAVEHLRACLALESGRNFQHRAELRLAEVMLAQHATDTSLGEVAELLDEAAGEAFFHSEAWRIAVARARLCARRKDPAGAAAHAHHALALLADNSPQFARHPDVGLIKTNRKTIKEMEKLAKAGQAAKDD
jgi:predicted negative regulator of RcsB-dependent stress response